MREWSWEAGTSRLRERGIDVLYAGALPIYTVAKMIPDLSSIPEVDGQLMAGDVAGGIGAPSGPDDGGSH